MDRASPPRPHGPRGAVAVAAGSAAAAVAVAWMVADRRRSRRIRGSAAVLAGAAARLRTGDINTPIPTVRAQELAPLRDEIEQGRAPFVQFVASLTAQDVRQHALLAVLRSPVLVAGSDGHITEVNPAAAALFGDPERLRGRPVDALLPFVTSAHRGEVEATWSGSVVDITGSTIDLEVSRAALGEGGAADRHAYILHDVSRHAELNRVREQLLHDVAHELRAPLTVLGNALEILADDNTAMSTEEFDRLVQSAGQTASRLRDLMEDLLSAGSIQAGRFAVSPRRTTVDALVDGAVRDVRHVVDGSRQQVDTTRVEGGLTVRADPRHAGRVLTNLLSNASKYSSEGAVIVVAANRQGAMVRIAVEDDGPGIPAEEQAGLFERFYRVRPRGQEPGIGLGLAIAEGIVEAHGGEIGIDSRAGSGTRVWITLPAITAEDETRT